jgi:hypothetical protein
MAYLNSRLMKIIRPRTQFVLALGAFALLPCLAFGQAAVNDSLAEVAVFRQLKQGVAANERSAVAALFVYPFRVNRTPTSHLLVKSRAELLRRYDAILTPKVRRAILAQNPDSLFYSWRGSMAGNGAVWIDGVCDDPRAQKCQFGVTAINLSAPR